MAHHNYRNLVLVVAIVALGTVLWWAVRHQQHVTPEPLTGEHRAVAYQTPPVKPGATPLEVVFKSPAGPEYSTEGAPTIVATFSQAMVPLGEVTQDGGLKALQISPPLPGRYRWIGTRTCTFIPEHLPYATHFTVTVPAGLVSQEGSTLPQAVTWTFDTTRPSLVANFPSDDHAEPKAAIYLRFDQPVRAGDVHPTISPTTPVHIRQATPDDVNTLGQAGWGVLDATDIVVLQPDQPLPLGTQFTVTIPKGTMGAQGDLGTDSDGTATFSTYSALKFDAADCGKTMDPGDGVSFRFNNAIKPADLFKHLKVDPAPPGPAPADDEESPSVYLALGWKCNTTYHYTIDGDLADTYGQKLGQSVTGTFTTGHLTRSLTFKTGLWSLESRLPHAVPVGVVNIKSLQVGVQALHRDQLVPLLLSLDSSSHVGHLPLHAWTASQHADVETWNNLDLSQALKNAHGLVEVQLVDPTQPKDEEYRFKTTVVQVTDLALNLKTAAENTNVWVTRLSQGTPVKDADVELRDPSNKVVWRGKTDAQGLAQAPGWQTLGIDAQSYGTPEMVAIASVGDDMVVTPSGTVETWDFGIYGNTRTSFPSTEIFLFSERGLYRAGETVHYKGIARQIVKGQWIVPKPTDVDVTVSDARGQQFKAVSLKSDAAGSFDTSFNLPLNAPSGDWSLSASIDSRNFSNTFQVQAFRPVTFETKVTTGHPWYEQGAHMDAHVSGQYLFGAPVQNGLVTWTTTLDPGADSFADYEGWAFGPAPELQGFERYGETPEPVILAKGQTHLAADGTLVLEAPLVSDKIGGADHSLTIEATVEAPDHRQVSGRTSVPLYAGQFTIGLKEGTDFLEAGKPQAVQVVALGHDGKPQSGRKVHVSLVRRDWDSVRHDPEGAWDSTTNDKEISSQDVTTGDKPVAADIAVKDAGWYFLKATAKDDQSNTVNTSTSFWCYGGGYVAWERDGTDKINLVANEKQYKPGDTAHIMVQNPFESAWALVTVERELILERHVVQLHGSAPVVDIPIDSKDIPNIFVSIVLIQGRTKAPTWNDQGEDPGQPSFKLGYLNIPIEADSKKLKVTVTPDHAEYRPGDTVKVSLTLQNAQGQGTAGTITLSAVDLGVLNLINYQTPDPWTDFYGPRGLGIENAETRSCLLGAHKPGEKGGGGGLDAAEDLNVRKNFKLTAYWNPTIQADSTGHAEVSFKLPDNLSRFRLMAVAQTPDSFGSGQQEFQVNKPIVLSGTMPRFATVGDDFTAGVVVTNRSAAARTITVQAQVKNAQLTDSPSQAVDVPANGTKVVLFNYQAPPPDPNGGELPTVVFRYSARAGDDSDDLELPMPIQTPKFLEAVATSNDTETSASETVTVPKHCWPGMSRVEVTLASTAMGELRNAMEALVRYPYGCLEQKLSRVYPMLLGQQIAPQFGISGFDTKGAHLIIQGFIDNFHTYQKSSGGCTLWGNPNDDECPFASVYAYLFLVQAKARGYDVPKDALQSLQEYIGTLASLDGSGWKWHYSESDKLTTQCLAVMAESMAGLSVDGSINRLYDQRAKLPVVAQSWLLRAMVRSKGFQPQTQTLVEHFQQSIQLDPAQGYIDAHDTNDEWIYDSPVRTTACVLSALVEAGATAHTPEIMAWLLKHSSGGAWGTTQENAWCLEAALAYLHKMEAKTPNFTVDTKLNGQSEGTAKFAGRSTKVEHQAVPLPPALEGQTVPLTLDKEGDGRLYYTMRLFYSPKQPADWAQDQGLAIDKAVFDLDGHEVSSFKAGQIYQVTLTVVAPRERSFVAVNDPLPGGLEVVNTDFETESKALGAMLAHKRGQQEAADGPIWGTFNHWEIYDDRVQLFADSMVPGAHRFTYLVRAMYPGTYWQGPSHVEAMYQPEIFGSTTADNVTVKP